MRLAVKPIVLALALPAVHLVAASSLTRRATTDVCANVVNQPLAVTVSSGIPPVTIGLINVCLCLSGISNFQDANIVAEAAVAVAGVSATTTSLTSLINRLGESCTYPDHASPVCSASNPCGFNCQDGFTADANSCVCASPNVVCNDVCGSYPNGCPTTAMNPARRRASVRKRAQCEPGLTACGVYNWKSSEGWECVDTRSDLESCGGCAIPLHYASPRGVDCTALPGVADVSCRTGSCLVHRCLPGYQISHDGTFCVRISQITHMHNEEDAAAYGLEHFPLKV